jgi:dTDP-glucose 4,6-dehydratase
MVQASFWASPAVRNLSQTELTGYILAACGAADSRIDYVPDRLGHDRRYAMNCRKARDELGFSPQRSTFPDGLLSVVKWYRENEDWWRPLQQKARPQK